ncbi:hypothetical protein ACS0TY_010962 [Phlomoides rotata]
MRCRPNAAVSGKAVQIDGVPLTPSPSRVNSNNLSPSSPPQFQIPISDVGPMKGLYRSFFIGQHE